MPWETPPRHNCWPPALIFALLDGRDEGDTWWCDKCGARHRITRRARGLVWMRLDD